MTAAALLASQPVYENRNWNRGSTSFSNAEQEAASLWSSHAAPVISFNLQDPGGKHYVNELSAVMACTRSRGQVYDIYNSTAVRSQMRPVRCCRRRRRR